MKKKEDRERLLELQEKYYKETKKYKAREKARSEWYRKQKDNPDAPCPKVLQEPIIFLVPTDAELVGLHDEDHWTHTKVGDFNKFIEQYFDSAIRTFKRQNNREPSLREFIKYFIEKLKRIDEQGYYGYFVVNLSCENTELEKGLRKLITDKREAQRIKANKPVIRKRLDELERYLKVYKLKKQGLKWKDIIEKYGRGDNGGSTIPTLRVKFGRDYNNAEKIIKNLEKNKGFPIY